MTRAGSHHAEWLGLIEISGPFLSLPVLERVFPQGLDVLDQDHAAKLRLAREEWAEENERPDPDPEVHDAWVRFVLAETLEYVPEVLIEAGAVPAGLTTVVEEHGETLRPDFVVAHPDQGSDTVGARLLVKAYRQGQDLDGQIEESSWAASPAERMTYLCRAVGVRLGLVTNGERWTLVDASRGETPGYVSWYASLWSQEPLTLRAFRSLLGTRRFFGVDESETLEAMLAESATYQAEVTEQLGAQVRRAVEVLVQALDRADADTGRALLRDVSEGELYEAALTIMMRLVFMFFAEENDLLPLRDDLYQQNYAASTLRGQLREEADRVGIEVLERRQDAWPRLLATFRAIYAGVEHDALRLPAYGGSLFDPDRFPFLEGRLPETTWQETDAQPLPVDNRTTLHLLDALQVLQMRGRRGMEARKLSFRSLDIEQIGHVYEMLLDHEVTRADAPGLGLVGAQGLEPEVGIDQLEEKRDRGKSALLDFLRGETKKSRSTLEKALEKEPDPAWIERLRVACGDDGGLLERVLPYQALIRTDPWGEPIVIPKGSVFVAAGAERRTTGTYYTPRALTEEVVTYALEPLVYIGASEGKPRQEWKLKRPEEILELKVCDLAMGSGAFLVQVIRWLSERLVEAWAEAEETVGPITIEGDPLRGNASDAVLPSEPEERAALARRVVADRCIYGVDVNPLAVEMAKLSLWLVTLAKGRPFSFLDHALKCGDSLLGVHELDQIRYFHLDPARGKELHATLFDPTRHIERVVEEALELRRELESFTVWDVRDAEQKSELNRRANVALNRLRLLGDLVVGAAISTAGQGSDDLDKNLQGLTDRLTSMLEAPGTEVDELLRADALIMLNEGRPPLKPDRRTFHWPLEFPEVFLRDRPGFDVMVGNPPFIGGPKLTAAIGKDLREFAIAHIARDKRGIADLVVYFFLRAAALSYAFGFLATKTIAEGDSREVGLDQLLEAGWRIMRANRSRPWPGAANVFVAQVWLSRASGSGDIFLDGVSVDTISSGLSVNTRQLGTPYRLSQNKNRCFEGIKPRGNGFILEETEAMRVIENSPNSRHVVRPFLNAEDLLDHPRQETRRWIINVSHLSREQAERQYPHVWSLIEQRVKPDRQRKRDDGSFFLGGKLAVEFWKFERSRQRMRDAIRDFERVLVVAQTSNTLAPVLVNADQELSQALRVLAYDDFGHLALFSSSFHEIWARRWGSTLKGDLRYTASDVFETFPHPPISRQMSVLGEALDAGRDQLMLENRQGLTAIYNRVHNPGERAAAIVRLRQLHVTVDEALAGAYGWQDLDLDHDFYDTPIGVRYTLGPMVRTEVLNRLLELNHERHAAEGQQLSLGAGP